MSTQIEQELLKVKVRRWRNVRSGLLIIDPCSLVVYKRKLFGGPEKVVNFETSCLIGVEQCEASNGKRLVFLSPQGESSDEVFFFEGEKQAEIVNSTLVELLKEAEERKKREEAEAARLERERQEHLKQIREQFAVKVWEISEALWLITKADYSMVNAVIAANWDEVRQQYSTVWQQTDMLKKICQIELMTVLKELDEFVNSRNGEEVIKKASCLIKQLSEQVIQTETVWTVWQEQEEMLVRVLPNCNHWPYFLLFSTAHFEALLAAQIEDWASIDRILPLLKSSGVILHHCFYISLSNLLDELISAAKNRNTSLFTIAAGKIEKAVLNSFNAKAYEYKMTEQQLNE